MSKSYFLSLGYTEQDIRKLAVTSVGTAKQGSQLKVLGEPKKPLKLRTLEPIFSYNFTPVIIEDMAMDLNIAGPWMKLHKWDQIHTENAVRIHHHLLPLCPKHSVEAPRSLLHVAEKTTVPGNSMTVIPLNVREVVRGNMKAGSGYVRGCEEFMSKTDLSPWLNAVNTCDRKGNLLAAVINTRPTPIVVPAGQRYGYFTRTAKPSSWGQTPWRICVMDPESNEPERAVGKKAKAPGNWEQSKAKRERYLADFARKAKEKSPDRNEESQPQTPSFKTLDQKRKWLVQTFELDKKPCLQSPENLNKALDLLLEFFDFFSHDGSFGKTNLIEHLNAVGMLIIPHLGRVAGFEPHIEKIRVRRAIGQNPIARVQKPAEGVCHSRRPTCVAPPPCHVCGVEANS